MNILLRIIQKMLPGLRTEISMFVVNNVHSLINFIVVSFPTLGYICDLKTPFQKQTTIKILYPERFVSRDILQ